MAKYVKTEEGYTSKYDIGLATVEDMISIASATSAAQDTADNAQATADLKMNVNNPVGTGSFSMGRKGGSMIGQFSHAEGYITTASGDFSHAEGHDTAALSMSSHAEGEFTTAHGYNSHAEGKKTSASGAMSHAEGEETVASGDCSHAEGHSTKVFHRSQHVQGEYNITDTTGTSTNTRGTYAHIVGNGYGPSKRSNAHTLDWSGNAWFAGDVYTGSTSGTNKDAGSKKLATEEYVAKLAEEMPDKLPNPNALTFTGAVTGSYDGSAPLSVNIPSGGTGGASVEKQWRLLNTVTLTEPVSAIEILTDSDGNPFEISEFAVYAPLGVVASTNSQLLIGAIEPGAEFDEMNQTYYWKSIVSTANGFLGTNSNSILIKSDWVGGRYTVCTSGTYDIAAVALSVGTVRFYRDNMKDIGGVRLSTQYPSVKINDGTFYLYGR